LILSINPLKKSLKNQDKKNKNPRQGKKSVTGDT